MEKIKKNLEVKATKEYRTETSFQFMFKGNWLPDTMPYFSNFKKVDKSNELKRGIIPSYPTQDVAEKTQTHTFTLDKIEFKFTEEKYGNKSVCFLEIDGKPYARFVSKKVVISVIADTTSKSWNWVDQYIKGILGLKTAGSTQGRRSVEAVEV